MMLSNAAHNWAGTVYVVRWPLVSSLKLACPASGSRRFNMGAPTTLSELIALYLTRCRIEGLSPRTQHAYSETLARFQRSVAARGCPMRPRPSRPRP